MLYYMVMKTQRTVHLDSRAGEVDPVLPYFLLALVLVGMALYRMAVTDPEWNKAGGISSTARNNVLLHSGS